MELSTIMSSFHFLRPWWFALLPLALWWLFAMQGKGRGKGAWEEQIDPQLQPYLLVAGGKAERPQRWIAALALILAISALAGPVFRQLPRPLFRADSALVILLDLSRSMDAADVSPSRLTRAKLKVTDICGLRSEGQTALIAFAASPFVVTPLTDDTETIVAQLGALDTAIMPAQGSRIDLAVNAAADLLKQAGLQQGDILLITDGSAASSDISLQSGFRLHVLAVGTEDGAPIPKPGGGFLTDKAGSIIIPRLEVAALQQLASDHGGVFSQLRVDDLDIAHLAPEKNTGGKESEEDQLSADQWIEEGPWLLLPLLPIAAWLAGKRLVVILVVGFFSFMPRPAQALDWQSLWRNPDQQGARSFNAEEYGDAAERFTDPRWKAASQYRTGNFEGAAQTLSSLETADDHYNRGNALARAGKIDEARKAYDEALKLNPDHADARYNRDLLPQQQSPDTGDQSSGDQGDQQQQEEQQGDQGQQQDQQGGEEQSGDQQQQSQGDEEQDSDEAKQARGANQQQDQQGEQSNESMSRSDSQENSPPEEGTRAEGADERDAQQEAPPASEESLEDVEVRQAREQWLRSIPDDPGGLLRRKFEYLYQQQVSKPEKDAW